MKLTLCFSFLFALLSISRLSAQSDSNSVRLLFIGDIMGHDAQIESAYDSVTGSYFYDEVFDSVENIIQNADFSIANLEVTLAGKPHKGYPQFSSPDELALALKNTGIDVLITANNHSCDRGKEGIIRTVNVLDIYDIMHTGTFRDAVDKDSINLLVLEKNNIRIGLLNYTYGTNGLPFPKPTIVNLINTDSILSDLEEARKLNLDKIIVTLHWGLEYQILPNDSQKHLAKVLFENGADIIIGSHPHVIQPMEYQFDSVSGNERIVVYSLGNFVSNQRKARTDGGAMIELVLEKKEGKTRVVNQGYYLTWVNKYKKNGKSKFQVLPCKENAASNNSSLDDEAIEKMQEFMNDSRGRLNAENLNFPELNYPR